MSAAETDPWRRVTVKHTFEVPSGVTDEPMNRDLTEPVGEQRTLGTSDLASIYIY